MRIIYLHQYFNTPAMPGGTRSYEMARRLVNAGHEVHMITSDRRSEGGGGLYRTVEAGIQVHWLPIPYGNAMPYHRRIWAFFAYALRAGLYASRIRGDLVFATSTPLTVALPAVYAKKRQKVPMVFEIRDLWPELPIAIGALKGPLIVLARRLERFAYRHSKQIIALSPGIKEGVLRTCYPEKNIHVIPNSCDIDLFQVAHEKGVAFRKKFEWLSTRPLVVYAGTFGRINGVGYLPKLASEVLSLDTDIRFLAIGEGYEEKTIKRMAFELGVLDKNFFMLPSLPKSQIPDIFSAATITMSTFIDLPQMWANSANKFFDSLAAGRPVAINYEGWQADLLRETGAGVVLPPNDMPRGAKILVKAITDYRWVKKAGKAALDLARNRFSRDRLANQLEKVLIKAANGHRAMSGRSLR
ncbi:glycosyltransferase, group 1 family protein [delta proteobacterium NaphS2]|nr:glycosyltransferase, group 1 family protein [delta proteobacterium NaphS2]